MNIIDVGPLFWAAWYGAFVVAAIGIWWQTKSWVFVATIISWAGIGSLFGFTLFAAEPIELPVCVTLGALIVAFGSWFDGMREGQDCAEVRK